MKTQDEIKALQLCQSKVRAKKLPMEVVDAEYQWYVMDVVHDSFFDDDDKKGSTKIDVLLRC